jgi:hypothetical protein
MLAVSCACKRRICATCGHDCVQVSDADQIGKLDGGLPIVASPKKNDGVGKSAKYDALDAARNALCASRGVARIFKFAARGEYNCAVGKHLCVHRRWPRGRLSAKLDRGPVEIA